MNTRILVATLALRSRSPKSSNPSTKSYLLQSAMLQIFFYCHLIEQQHTLARFIIHAIHFVF
jgi:hypothetical protein